MENGADRVRTDDHLVMSQALYLAKLQPLSSGREKVINRKLIRISIRSCRIYIESSSVPAENDDLIS